MTQVAFAASIDAALRRLYNFGGKKKFFAEKVTTKRGVGVIAIRLQNGLMISRNRAIASRVVCPTEIFEMAKKEEKKLLVVFVDTGEGFMYDPAKLEKEDFTFLTKTYEMRNTEFPIEGGRRFMGGYLDGNGHEKEEGKKGR